MVPVLAVFKIDVKVKSVFSSLLLRLLHGFRKDKCKDSSSKKRARKFLRHFSLLIPKRMSYRFSLPWSLIMTDVHGAEFTNIIVSSRAGKRIFIVGGGGTERHDVETEDKTRVHLLFFFFSYWNKIQSFSQLSWKHLFQSTLTTNVFHLHKCSLFSWFKN